MADRSDLMAFVSQVGGDAHLRVEESLGSGYVRLRVAEAERRQARHDIRCVEDMVIEMLRNARDAGAAHIYVASSREGNLRTITMLDDGVGIPKDMHDKVFEARVTSKLDSMHMDRWGVHGRGMALYAVRENAVSACVTSSDEGLGTAMQVVANTITLPERTDQSSWPRVGTSDDGMPDVVRGPHNIIRTCCEFALEEHGSLEVYLGSPSEIVATARHRVRPRVGSHQMLFANDLGTLPVLERLAVASDAMELRDVAAGLGLEMSERTAHRIVSGQIRPQCSVYSMLVGQRGVQAGRDADLMADPRGLRLAAEDVSEFSGIMEQGFDFLASRYYLRLCEDPRIRVSRGRVTVTFEFEDDG